MQMLQIIGIKNIIVKKETIVEVRIVKQLTATVGSDREIKLENLVFFQSCISQLLSLVVLPVTSHLFVLHQI